MTMKPDIVTLDLAAEIISAPPTTEIKPWVPGEELDLKKIIQADRRYDLFGTETDEDQDVPDLQKLLQSLGQQQGPQQYYVFWEEKTKQPIFGKEREGMYDGVVVTDIKTIGKNVVQYSINGISQYGLIETGLPLIYIIPPEQQANPDQLEQQDPQQADPDDSENNQEQSEDQDSQQGDSPEEQQPQENEQQDDSENDSQSDEQHGKNENDQSEQDSENTEGQSPTEKGTEPQVDDTDTGTTDSENDNGEEGAEKIVKAGAKKVTPEELLTLPKQEFVLAKRNSTIISADGTETPNASYHTVKIFDNTQSTSTTTGLYVHEGKIKYFYSNEDGRVGQKKHSTYDKDWCLYWIAKASW